MATVCRTCLFGLLALALAAPSARADDPTIISAHGDALARATSAQALVEPMPANPPNTPAAPKAAEPEADAPPPPPIPLVPPQGDALTDAAPALSASVQAASAPVVAAPSEPPTAPPPATNGKSRAGLIVLGALAALGLFLWERRKPG